MPDTHHRFIARRSAWLLLLGGLSMAVIGWLPLQWSIWFGPADANPIGYGLLAITALPIGLILAGFGLLRLIIVWLVGRRT